MTTFAPAAAPSLNPLTTYGPEPLISVILRTHDAYTPFLKRSVGSVLDQDLPPELYELIIVHDGEPNSLALDIIEDLTNLAPIGCRFLATPRKYGYYAMSSNMATIHAAGAYITYLDADNEWRPNHLRVLLTAMRSPHPYDGCPHFAYVRREYVRDEGAPEDLPVGPSPLQAWTPETASMLTSGPRFNFIDSSDFMIGKATLYRLADLTGKIWNDSIDRFGDWELFTRIAKCGFRGRAVDAVTHIYHWHSGNLQHTRPAVDFVTPVPLDRFEEMREQGIVKVEEAPLEETP